MDQTQAAPEAHITYYGGKWVAFAPILLAIVGLIYIAVKQADVPEYWVVFLLPMIVCLFLAKDKTAYCEAIIEGATNKVGGILIMAVLLAGICGQLIETSGLVDTLAHYLIELNFLGNKFVAASFLLTCLIAFSTGTSVGTIFVVGPILYPHRLSGRGHAGADDRRDRIGSGLRRQRLPGIGHSDCGLLLSEGGPGRRFPQPPEICPAGRGVDADPLSGAWLPR